MSFAVLSLCFLLGSLVLFAAALRLRRISLATVAPALGIAGAILLVLTAVFDNLMIASGLFDYGAETLIGVHLGLAPLEDFAYPLAAVLFMPALWWLAGGSHPAPKENP